MLDHVSITVSDIARAAPFWDAIMAALGVDVEWEGAVGQVEAIVEHFAAQRESYLARSTAAEYALAAHVMLVRSDDGKGLALDELARLDGCRVLLVAAVAVTGDLKYACSALHINAFTRESLANVLRVTGWQPLRLLKLLPLLTLLLRPKPVPLKPMKK